MSDALAQPGNTGEKEQFDDDAEVEVGPIGRFCLPSSPSSVGSVGASAGFCVGTKGVLLSRMPAFSRVSPLT